VPFSHKIWTPVKFKRSPATERSLNKAWLLAMNSPRFDKSVSAACPGFECCIPARPSREQVGACLSSDPVIRTQAMDTENKLEHVRWMFSSVRITCGIWTVFEFRSCCWMTCSRWLWWWGRQNETDRWPTTVLVLIESANPCSIKHVNKYIVLLVERDKGKVDVSCQGLTRENVGSTVLCLCGVRILYGCQNAQ
jgi:hypothetical protein